MLGRIDQFSTKLCLMKGGKYVVQVEGLNPMSLIGFYDAPLPHAISAVSSRVSQNNEPAVSYRVYQNNEPVVSSRVSQNNESSVSGPKSNIGIRTGEPVGMRIEPMNTRAQPQGVETQETRAQHERVENLAQPAEWRVGSSHAELLGMRSESAPTQNETVGKRSGMVGAEGEAVGMRAETQTVTLRTRAQDARMLAEAETVEKQAKPVGYPVEAIETRAEAVQRSSSVVSTTRPQHLPLQTSHVPAVAAPPSRATKSTLAPSKNMLMRPSKSASAVTPAIESTPTAPPNASIPTSFPFTPSLGLYSKAALPAGNLNSGIHASMHAPTTEYATASHAMHASTPAANPLFRFNTPSMSSAEAPGFAFTETKPLVRTGSASSIRTEHGDLGPVTPLRADKGKTKAIPNVEIVPQPIYTGTETDTEDI
ncbi:hypothetical protein EV361DRAFT_955578 [Lentinula raphanica]|nr:hypothetical protein EV361DRAFT_955578 [Lentinula raphanica]